MEQLNEIIRLALEYKWIAIIIAIPLVALIIKFIDVILGIFLKSIGYLIGSVIVAVIIYVIYINVGGM